VGLAKGKQILKCGPAETHHRPRAQIGRGDANGITPGKTADKIWHKKKGGDCNWGWWLGFKIDGTLKGVRRGPPKHPVTAQPPLPSPTTDELPPPINPNARTREGQGTPPPVKP